MQEEKVQNSIAYAADKLIAAHDGDVALLYIYIARTGCTDPDKAANALCRTMSEISAAWEKLQRMELIPAAGNIRSQPSEEALLPSDELPQYTAEDIVSRSRSDESFSAIVSDAQRIMAKKLNSTELIRLFGIYDYYGMPAEVVMVLLNYCAQSCHERYGDTKRPTMKSIEDEARIWAREEIMTLEQADEYIRTAAARSEARNVMAEAVGIRNRPLTATETRYISAWMDMGFSADALAIAYDRTVTNTGSMRWNYMNKILLSWHQKGLHTPQQIEEKDGRRPAVSAVPARKNDVDIDKLRSIMEKI